MSDSFDVIRMADPAGSGTEAPESVMSQGALLALIDEKVIPMPVQTPTKPEPSTQRNRRGWLAAAAAFGAVLLVGAAVIWAAGPTTAPPAEVPAPTTTAVSPEQEAGPATSTTVPIEEPTTTLAQAVSTYVGSVTVEFDGASCTSDGPSEFTVGKRLHWILHNNADTATVSYGLSKVADGTTIADLKEAGLDAVAEEPRYHSSEWHSRENTAIAGDSGAADPGEDLSWPIPLDATGTWAVVCFSGGNELPALIVEVADA